MIKNNKTNRTAVVFSLSIMLFVLMFVWAVAGVTTSPILPVVKDLNGTWMSIEEDDAPSYRSAIIGDGELRISVVDNDDKSRMLYWVGTIPEDVVDGESFISKADTKALESSILGSSLKEKKFTFKDNKITFEQSLMGVTWVVTMRKVE